MRLTNDALRRIVTYKARGTTQSYPNLHIHITFWNITMDLYIMLACAQFIGVFLALVFLGPISGVISLASKNSAKQRASKQSS